MSCGLARGKFQRWDEGGGEAGKSAGYAEIMEPGEVLRYRTSLSRMIYRWPALIAILITWGLFQWNDWHNPSVVALAFLAFIFCSLNFFRVWIRRLMTEVAVTDRRIIHKTGFLWRSTEELNMESIESINVKQSIIGRMLDYGFVVVRGSGSTWSGGTFIVDSPLALRATMTRSGGSHERFA
jgi:hypothetical protein